MPEINELREEMGRLNAQARKIIDEAVDDSKNKRELTAEESAQVDSLYDKYDETKARVEKIEADEQRRRRAAEDAQWLDTSPGRSTVAERPVTYNRNENQQIELNFGSRGGLTWGAHEGGWTTRAANTIALTPDHPSYRTATPEYRRAFSQWLLNPRAALQADLDTAGGFTVLPMQMSAQLIQAVDDAVLMRRLGTVHPPIPQAQSLGIASLDNDPADPSWSAEIGTVGEDSTMSFGRRELSPSLLSKLIKVSMKFLRASAVGGDAIVRERLAYKFAIAAEKGYLVGTGAIQPLGVFTAHASGITTSQDVSTGNTTTTIEADNLFEVKYSLKEQYQNRGSWIFHRDAVKMIRKLKDGTGQYLWQPGLQGGQPNMLLDRPVFMSEYAPNTFTTGLYVGIFGDMSYYHIVDAMGVQIQLLSELYAVNNQVGYIGRMESDGMPVLSTAFARVKLA